MKCNVCGFDDEEKQELETWEVEKKFIEIEGHFTARSTWKGRVGVEIFACPKCGTVRLEDGWSR